MRFSRIFFALVLVPPILAATVACGGGDGGFEPPTDTIQGTLTAHALRVDGTLRRYLAFVPADLPAQNRPLMIALHGVGSFGEEFFNVTGLDFLADSLGFVALFPDGLQVNWNPSDTTFLNLMIDSAAVRHGTDPTQAHLLGFSQGGGMGNLFLCQDPSRVKSLVVIGASLLKEAAEECDISSDPTHVFYLIGRQDAVAPWNETAESLGGRKSARFWAEANECEGEPEEVDDGSTVRLNWDQCRNGARVRMIGVYGGGHFFFPRQNFNTLGELVEWLGPIL